MVIRDWSVITRSATTERHLVWLEVIKQTFTPLQFVHATWSTKELITNVQKLMTEQLFFKALSPTLLVSMVTLVKTHQPMLQLVSEFECFQHCLPLSVTSKSSLEHLLMPLEWLQALSVAMKKSGFEHFLTSLQLRLEQHTHVHTRQLEW